MPDFEGLRLCWACLQLNTHEEIHCDYAHEYGSLKL